MCECLLLLAAERLGARGNVRCHTRRRGRRDESAPNRRVAQREVQRELRDVNAGLLAVLDRLPAKRLGRRLGGVPIGRVPEEGMACEQRETWGG